MTAGLVVAALSLTAPRAALPAAHPPQAHRAVRLLKDWHALQQRAIRLDSVEGRQRGLVVEVAVAWRVLFKVRTLEVFGEGRDGGFCSGAGVVLAGPVLIPNPPVNVSFPFLSRARRKSTSHWQTPHLLSKIKFSSAPSSNKDEDKGVF